MARTELVLLVENGRHGQECLRPVTLKHPVNFIVERCHVADNAIHERQWRCTDDERALTGQRIFREVLAPAPPEPSENPVFDELVIKTPLPLTARES